jgi:hypothetical protein
VAQADVERVVAVDWSGDKSVAGQRKKIWAGVWTAEEGKAVYGGDIELENRRTRGELRDWLIEKSLETPRMVAGVDFCFSYPAWFVKEHGARTAPEFWEIVKEHGERWLGHECEDVRFWGRIGKHRSGKKPVEFYGDLGHRMLRRADEACKVQAKILDPSEAVKVKGIAPKSPFQIGGAGAVGTGTLRGIPILHDLRKAGFRVWPFDVPTMPLLLEIYPRLMTGAVNKGSVEARTEYLAKKLTEDFAYKSLDPTIIKIAVQSEDAFDALISVMVMARERKSFTRLHQATDEMTLLEGAVWGARV